MIGVKKKVVVALALNMILANIPIDSFANEINIEQNEYTEEINNTETKENLQKSAQKAVVSDTSNIDVYVKPESILSVSLNTNSVTFNEFDGINDVELPGSLELTVDSNLSYNINAILESEIRNSDGTKIMDKSILGIKANTDSAYSFFSSVGDKIILFENMNAVGAQNHLIDLCLKGGIPYEEDNYKTTIKIEVLQK